MDFLNAHLPPGSLIRQFVMSLAVSLAIMVLKKLAIASLSQAKLAGALVSTGLAYAQAVLRSDRDALIAFCAWNSTAAVMKMGVAIIAFLATGATYAAHRFTITTSTTALTVIYWIALLSAVGNVLDLWRVFWKFFVLQDHQDLATAERAFAENVSTLMGVGGGTPSRGTEPR